MRVTEWMYGKDREEHTCKWHLRPIRSANASDHYITSSYLSAPQYLSPQNHYYLDQLDLLAVM